MARTRPPAAPQPSAQAPAPRAGGATYRWPTIAELWTFLGFALPALAALLVPMPSVDLAYQLRAGADILATGSIPSVDTWTFTVAGTPWVDQQWGAQVLLAAVYQAAGWTGLALLRAALVAVAFGLLQATLRAMGCAQRPAALLALGAFVVAAPALALRAQLFAIVLFVLALYVIAGRRAHPRRLWFLPLIAVVWANVHGTFPILLVVVGLGWLDELVRRRLAAAALRAAPKGFQPPPDPGAAARLFGSTGIAILGAASALATLLNPFGVEAWWYVVRLARNPEISQGISEWQPPSPVDPAGAIFYASLVIAALVVILRIRADGNRVRLPILAPTAALLAFGALGVLTGRGLAWWAFVLPLGTSTLAHDVGLTRYLPRILRPIGTLLTGPAPTRSDGAPTSTGAAGAARPRASRGSPLNFAVGTVLVLAAVALLPLWRPLGTAGVPIGTLSFAPQGIAAELRTLVEDGDIQRRVWQPQVWGSWLEYAVPQARYVADSRVELFPLEVWRDVNQVANGRDDWLGVLDRADVTVLVLTADETARLSDALTASSRWGPRYADQDGSIWVLLATKG